MKISSLMAGFVITIMAISVLSMGSFAQTRADNTISYIDPSGDVDNTGGDAQMVKNTDILALTLDRSSDPIVLTLKVDGLIDYSGSNGMYMYYFFLDQVGDGSESTSAIIYMGTASLNGEFIGLGPTPEVTGNGTDTLTLKVNKSDIDESNHPIMDVYAEIDMTVIGQMVVLSDVINEDFGEGTSTDDDDDDDDEETDADGDLMPDSWEQLHGLDTSINDADEDHDGDGYTNFEEYVWGTAPDDINSYPDMGFDDDDDDDDTNDNPDPTAETPTDDSITVTINNVDYSVDAGDDTFEMEHTIDGTTTGTVHHCSMTMVTYYDDGTYEADDWQVGPDEEPRSTMLGITTEMYFKGTGPGGNTDWSEWAWYMYAKAPMSWYDKLVGPSDEDNTTDDDGPEISKIFVVVRAYSDASEANWNQDSKDITEEIMDFWGGDQTGGGDNDSPGLGIPLLIGSIAVIALIGIFRRKRE